MERSRLLQCLAADYMRLREVAGTGLNAQVPSCPGWTVSDLVRHVGQVYLHKALVMQTGAWPDPWPPKDTVTEDPIALLDRSYGAVTHEFSRRGDTDRALTWHDPDQTVKFWIRRMAQESVIHRLDAELAHDLESAPIPDDLAVDGIDEILRVMVDFGSHAWHEDLTDLLATAKGRTVRVQAPLTPSPADPAASADGSPAPATTPAWLVRIDPEGATVTALASPAASAAAATQTTPDAVVTGSPADLLRWLWSRESTPTTDAHPPIQVDGDEEAINELQALLRALTQ
ncbi:MAG TPA: maleylpyruvate isomerase N-terminal domain-containing protein [Dactylosporangium sp.]|nr:maleylpyruvate isomerase N-terminal domain-containing protein [Dactylosporangium sp.]